MESLYSQKKRWGVGGLDSDISGFSVMAVGVITHIFMLLLPFFFSITALSLVLFKVFIDYVFVLKSFKKLNLKLPLSHYIVFEIYFILYVTALPFIVLINRKVKWKGREF